MTIRVIISTSATAGISISLTTSRFILQWERFRNASLEFWFSTSGWNGRMPGSLKRSGLRIGRYGILGAARSRKYGGGFHWLAECLK